jgi:hypothetical protein
MALIFGSKTTRANAGVGNTTTVGAYTVHQFTTSANFTPATTGFVDVLLVGGGGSSPATNEGGGGGAGASLLKKMAPVVAGTPYPVSIGGAGNPTTFTYSGGITTTAFAGAAGGVNLGNGGSEPRASGGGSGRGGTGGTGAGVLGIGYPGGTHPNAVNGAGAGGGAGGAGLQTLSSPGAGGPGVPISYFTGISTDIVSVGGGAPPTFVGITSTSYGSGSATFGTPGAGRSGVAYIRYI